MQDEDRGLLPIGPFFASLEEPIHFRISVKGEEVVGCDIRIGYNHRGVEKLAEGRPYLQVLYLVERICGICSNVHPSCFVQACEEIAGVNIPERARYLRTLVMEFERIHSHLLWIGLGAHFMGLDTLFMHAWKDREIVLDLFETITGNRVTHAWNTIGGVRRDLKKEQIPSISEHMKRLEKSTTRYINAFMEDRTAKARLQGVGILTPDQARKLSVLGPTARASGLKIDVRKDDPYAAYKEVSFDVVTRSEGDVMAKATVRLLEILQSIEIIRQVLDQLPQGDIAVPVDQIPAGEGFGRAEAPRGEDFHYVKSNGSNIPERLKIRAPSYMNMPSVVPMLLGNTVADVPLIIASIDPCISCTERVAIVDESGRETITYTEDLVAKYGKSNRSRR